MGQDPAGEVLLAAVQAHMTLEDYASEEAFFEKLAGLLRPLGTAGVPVLAVLPEDIGSFLALAGEGAAVTGAPSLDAAFRRIAIRRLPQVLARRVLGGAVDVREALHLVLARRVGPAYRRVIRRLAAEIGIWVVGGSALLPRNRLGEDALGFAALGHAVYNLGITADPSGRIVATALKVNLVPTQEDHLGLTPGRPEDAAVFSFAGHPTGVLICYDGFVRPHTDREPGFCPLAPHLDRAGAEILAQPSANPWPWEESWPLDPGRLRKDAWHAESLEAAMQGLRSVRFGVNAQLLAGFLGLHFDGRSRIFGRGEDGQVTVLAEAERADLSPEAECVVSARVRF